MKIISFEKLYNTEFHITQPIASLQYWAPRGNVYSAIGKPKISHTLLWFKNCSATITSKEEYDLAATNLEKYNHNVDYIITHCGPNSIIEDKLKLERDELTTFFENYVNKFVTFKQWFMGHYHFDCSTKEHKYNLIYDDILRPIYSLTLYSWK